MSYVISTQIDGVYHFIRPNAEKNTFELLPMKNQSDLYKAFNPSHKTEAINILNWIKKNDETLAQHEYSIELQAKFQR